MDELVEHCGAPEAFDPLPDSYWASKTAPELAEQWEMLVDDILAGFTSVLDELRQEFSVAAAEIADTLLERTTIPQQACEALYRHLDARFSMVNRPPKSDFICRSIAKQFGWKVPEGMVMRWDFKPLPAGYVVPMRMGLMELAERVKGQSTG